MKNFYFGIMACSGSRTIRSTYLINAANFRTASLEVMRQTEWLWTHPDYSFELREYCVFGFARLKESLAVETIVLERNGVKV